MNPNAKIPSDLSFHFGGAVVAQWIRPRTLNREVPSLNLLAEAVYLFSLPSPYERT